MLNRRIRTNLVKRNKLILTNFIILILFLVISGGWVAYRIQRHPQISRNIRLWAQQISQTDYQASPDSGISELDSLTAGELLKRGRACEKEGQVNLAIKLYTQAIEIDSTFTEAYYARGLALARLGEYYKGLEDLNRAVELSPDWAQGYFGRGLLFNLIHDEISAEKDFKKAQELKHPEAEEELERLYRR